MRLFALGATSGLGEAVARAMDTELDPLEERTFEGGEHKIRPLVSVRHEDVYILQSLAEGDKGSPAESLIRLLFFIGCCRDNGAGQVTAVIPHLAFLRKDQQTKPRDPTNSRYVAQLLESMGVNVVVALDPHNKSAFQNAVRCRNVVLDSQALFAARAGELVGERPTVFVSPDSGGIKRAHLLREAFEALHGRSAGLAFMEKHRSEGVVTGDLFAGEVSGADAIIVDDMISTGGTMLRAAEACRARGAARVYAFATHHLRVPGSEALHTSTAIDRLVVTDSVAAATPADKLEVISCAPLLAEAIQRLHGHGSISRLLNPRR